MSFFNFGKKPQQSQETPAPPSPVDQIIQMRKKNFSNHQIVQTMQKNGYQTHQIFDALNQADMKSGAPIENAVPPELAQQPIAPVNQKPVQTEEIPSLEAEQPPEQSPVTEEIEREEKQTIHEDQIEEIAEAIIEEKWEDLMKEIKKLMVWKEGMTAKMAALEQSFADMKMEYDKLHSNILGKVVDYDRTIKVVGTDMKAMESVFKKIIPALTDNVNELSRLSRKTEESSSSRKTRRARKT